MSITIMSKGGKLKSNTVLELCSVSAKNASDPWLLDVPSAHKHACFACESKASSSKNKIYDLECSTPPHANVVVKLIFPGGLPLAPKPTMRESLCF